mgnify:CR=1 FL=1
MPRTFLLGTWGKSPGTPPFHKAARECYNQLENVHAGWFKFMSSLDKMWASFIGMGLMIAASLIITFARTKTKGFVRGVLSLVAFLFLFVSILYMLVSIF